MPIEYKIDHPITVEQFIAILADSSLGERRPVEGRSCMEGMVSNGNLSVTAWDAGKLVGISRCMTDFHYACYLSDLAVSRAYQKLGIGKKLQAMTPAQLGPRCKLILIAAPAANSYYEHMGYVHNPRCWVLERESEIPS